MIKAIVILFVLLTAHEVGDGYIGHWPGFTIAYEMGLVLDRENLQTWRKK